MWRGVNIRASVQGVPIEVHSLQTSDVTTQTTFLSSPKLNHLFTFHFLNGCNSFNFGNMLNLLMTYFVEYDRNSFNLRVEQNMNVTHFIELKKFY